MKKKQFLLTVFLPLLLSVIAGLVIIVLNNSYIINSRATAIVNKEKSEMNKAISELKSQKDTLDADIKKYDLILKDMETAASEIEFLTNELNTYTQDIESVMERIGEADIQIAEKNNYLNSISDITPEVQGEKLTLKPGEYKSPSQLKPGRYIAEGNGTIYIYTISNSLRLKENLSLISSHTYTFEINSGETLKIDNTLSFTELTK